MANNLAQIKGIAPQDIGAGELVVQISMKCQIMLDKHKISCRNRPRQDRSGYGTCTWSQFQNRKAQINRDAICHRPGKLLAGRSNSTNAAGLFQHAREKTELIASHFNNP